MSFILRLANRARLAQNLGILPRKYPHAVRSKGVSKTLDRKFQQIFDEKVANTKSLKRNVGKQFVNDSDFIKLGMTRCWWNKMLDGAKKCIAAGTKP